MSWEQEWRKKKAIQASRTQINTKISLSQVTKCLEWFWTLERIWSLVCVLEWSLELLYWMQYAENLDALNSGGWGVFIAPTTKTVVGEGCYRWAHRTVRCASHVTQLLGFWQFRSLELWHLGAPDRHCLLSDAPSGAALTLRELSVHCSRCRRSLESTVALLSHCSAGTPDSPVTHRTVWWIIAELLSRNPKVKSLKSISPGHRTLSGAPD
jgi:hypothetical protein